MNYFSVSLGIGLLLINIQALDASQEPSSSRGVKLTPEIALRLINNPSDLALWASSQDELTRAEVLSALAYYEPGALKQIEQPLQLKSRDAITLLEQSGTDMHLLDAGYLSLIRGDQERGYKLFERSNDPDALRIVAGKLYDRYHLLSDEHKAEKASIRVKAINTAKKYLTEHPDDPSMNYCVGMLLHANGMECAARDYLIKAFNIEDSLLDEDSRLDVEALTAVEDIDMAREKARKELRSKIASIPVNPETNPWESLLANNALHTILSDNEIAAAVAHSLSEQPERTPGLLNYLTSKPKQKNNPLGKKVVTQLSAQGLAHCSAETIKKAQDTLGLSAEESRALGLLFVSTFSTTTFNLDQIDYFFSRYEKLVGKKSEFFFPELAPILQGQIIDALDRLKPSSSQLVASPYYKHVRKHALTNTARPELQTILMNLCKHALATADTGSSLEAALSDLLELANLRPDIRDEAVRSRSIAAQWYAQRIKKQDAATNLAKAIDHYKRLIELDQDYIPELFSLIHNHSDKVKDQSRLETDLLTRSIDLCQKQPAPKQLVYTLKMIIDYLENHSIRDTLTGLTLGTHINTLLKHLDEARHVPQDTLERELIFVSTKMAALSAIDREKKAEISDHIERLASLDYTQLVDLANRCEKARAYQHALDALQVIQREIGKEFSVSVEQRPSQRSHLECRAHLAQCLWRQSVVLMKQFLVTKNDDLLAYIIDRYDASQAVIASSFTGDVAAEVHKAVYTPEDLTTLHDAVRHVLNGKLEFIYQSAACQQFLELFIKLCEPIKDPSPELTTSIMEASCTLAPLGKIEYLTLFAARAGDKYSDIVPRIVQRSLEGYKEFHKTEPTASTNILESPETKKIAEVGLRYRTKWGTSDHSIICMLLNECANNQDLTNLIKLSKELGYGNALAAQRPRNVFECVVRAEFVDKVYNTITLFCLELSKDGHIVDVELYKEASLIQSHLFVERLHNLIVGENMVVPLTLFGDFPKKVSLLESMFPDIPNLTRLHAYTMMLFAVDADRRNNPRYPDYLQLAIELGKKCPHDSLAQTTVQECEYKLLMHQYNLASSSQEKKRLMQEIENTLNSIQPVDSLIFEEAYEFFLLNENKASAKRYLQRAIDLGYHEGKEILKTLKSARGKVQLTTLGQALLKRK